MRYGNGSDMKHNLELKGEGHEKLTKNKEIEFSFFHSKPIAENPAVDQQLQRYSRSNQSTLLVFFSVVPSYF